MAIKINLMPKKEGSSPEGEAQMPFYSLIVFVFFAISLLVYLGIYSYNTFFLKKQLDVAEKQNADIQSMISKSLTEEDALAVGAAIVKGKSIQTILSAHLYGSKIYELLEKITIKNVSYNKFSEKINNDNTISLFVDGEADSFNALSKQLIILKKTKEINEIIFLEALMGKNAKVAFSLILKFDSKLITTRPVITLSGSSLVNVAKGSVYSDAGAAAIDGVDGIVDVKTSGAVNTDIVGIYTLTYTAFNAAGNSATATRTVDVAAQ